MARAVKLAKRGPIANPNPRVGAVILNEQGQVIGEGWHQGAGTQHAEVMAMSDARSKGYDLRSSTIVVTLEPCNHRGFTPPCAETIVASGIGSVVYAVSDPGAISGGGAETLRANGISTQQFPYRSAEKLVRIWAAAISAARPYVTLKLATTLDGYVAAADGTSQWITCPASRLHAHKFRAKVGAIAVTTGTVLADDPALTARTPDDSLAASQPLAVVIGQREIPQSAKLRQAPGGFLHFRTHDVAEVLTELNRRGIRHLLVEGGPALASSMLAAGCVDEIHAYVAPKILGEGKTAVGPFGVMTLAEAAVFETKTVKQLGNDVFVAARAG